MVKYLLILFIAFPVLLTSQTWISGKVNDSYFTSSGVWDVEVTLSYSDNELGVIARDTTDVEGFFSFDFITGLFDQINPSEYILSQNYPNPFNPATNIEFYSPMFDQFLLEIFDVLGRRIGSYNFSGRGGHKFHISNLGSAGVYYYRISSERFSQTKKMILLDGGSSSSISINHTTGNSSSFAKLFANDSLRFDFVSLNTTTFGKKGRYLPLTVVRSLQTTSLVVNLTQLPTEFNYEITGKVFLSPSSASPPGTDVILYGDLELLNATVTNSVGRFYHSFSVEHFLDPKGSADFEPPYNIIKAEISRTNVNGATFQESALSESIDFGNLYVSQIPILKTGTLSNILVTDQENIPVENATVIIEGIGIDQQTYLTNSLGIAEGEFDFWGYEFDDQNYRAVPDQAVLGAMKNSFIPNEILIDPFVPNISDKTIAIERINNMVNYQFVFKNYELDERELNAAFYIKTSDGIVHQFGGTEPQIQIEIENHLSTEVKIWMADYVYLDYQKIGALTKPDGRIISYSHRYIAQSHDTLTTDLPTLQSSGIVKNYLIPRRINQADSVIFLETSEIQNIVAGMPGVSNRVIGFNPTSATNEKVEIFLFNKFFDDTTKVVPDSLLTKVQNLVPLFWEIPNSFGFSLKVVTDQLNDLDYQAALTRGSDYIELWFDESNPSSTDFSFDLGDSRILYSKLFINKDESVAKTASLFAQISTSTFEPNNTSIENYLYDENSQSSTPFYAFVKRLNEKLRGLVYKASK
ncbi:MAG: T9SS type A sorting domain-containing protein [Melioribacteraceae bacterium]|nr:T9SS type A sorting domain-containing protein [Melioribacteraceae bacterium]